jgi:hypothetical protein
MTSRGQNVACQFTCRAIAGRGGAGPDWFVKGLNMTALQGWIVIGLLVLIVLGIVGIGAELKVLPYLWRAAAEAIQPP